MEIYDLKKTIEVFTQDKDLNKLLNVLHSEPDNLSTNCALLVQFVDDAIDDTLDIEQQYLLTEAIIQILLVKESLSPKYTIFINNAKENMSKFESLQSIFFNTTSINKYNGMFLNRLMKSLLDEDSYKEACDIIVKAQVEFLQTSNEFDDTPDWGVCQSNTYYQSVQYCIDNIKDSVLKDQTNLLFLNFLNEDLCDKTLKNKNSKTNQAYTFRSLFLNTSVFGSPLTILCVDSSENEYNILLKNALWVFDNGALK